MHFTFRINFLNIYIIIYIQHCQEKLALNVDDDDDDDDEEDDNDIHICYQMKNLSRITI